MSYMEFNRSANCSLIDSRTCNSKQGRSRSANQRTNDAPFFNANYSGKPFMSRTNNHPKVTKEQSCNYQKCSHASTTVNKQSLSSLIHGLFN